MAIERVIKCDIKDCPCRTEEESFGDGFKGGWTQITGIQLNGIVNPILCPGHTHLMMNFVDSLEGFPIT